METVPKTIDGQLYFHYTHLRNWEKNNQVRTITDANRDKLTADIAKNGIEDAFKVGEDGTVYDGNHRLKTLRYLIEKTGVTTAQNGVDLLFVPVTIKHPTSEAQKWRYALTRNEQFASWLPSHLEEFLPEFENEIDLSLINVSFNEPQDIDALLEAANDAKEKEKKPKGEKIAKEVTCPNCTHKFTV